MPRSDQLRPSGYALDLGGNMVGTLHPDGALSLEAGSGAADLSPDQVEKLAQLLALGGGLRSQARRRRARAAYVARRELVEG